ncbi:MAG: NAD+ synthase, partial [Chitinophagaceae bacterium]|nr:NAD+ synthase [Chitinophagaceae bacterium]
MKIVLAQQNYHIGNFEANTNKIIKAVRDAKAQGADLVVFSELCVCGYPPRDFLEFNDFIEQSMSAVQQIAAEAKGIAILVGAPARNEKPEGKDLHNSVYFLQEKQIAKVIHKTLLPTY